MTWYVMLCDTGYWGITLKIDVVFQDVHVDEFTESAVEAGGKAEQQEGVKVRSSGPRR